MKTLDQIAIEHQTDKASQFTRTYGKPHDYCRHYERVFDRLRFHKIKLLEVGVGGGESIQTWLEYFKTGRIYGVDIVNDTNPYNSTAPQEIERYAFFNGDQSLKKGWDTFLEIFGEDWNIIIDDGSHILSDIITTFDALWTNVVSGGFYCIEDLAGQHMDWLRGLMDKMNAGESDIDSISFSRGLAILRKK